MLCRSIRSIWSQSLVVTTAFWAQRILWILWILWAGFGSPRRSMQIQGPPSTWSSLFLVLEVQGHSCWLRMLSMHVNACQCMSMHVNAWMHISLMFFERVRGGILMEFRWCSSRFTTLSASTGLTSPVLKLCSQVKSEQWLGLYCQASLDKVICIC
jgi:hypothetical protein